MRVQRTVRRLTAVCNRVQYGMQTLAGVCKPYVVLLTPLSISLVRLIEKQVCVD